MVFHRRHLLSTLWIPLTILLFAATWDLSTQAISERDPLNDGDKTMENGTYVRNLTGIPQIDYKTDPNLPRELNGYDLSDYPFFNKVPSNITFKCDGLKDGFYASVEHKCQLYHHCLFGTRYDFLCANYTAFDQRTFICQFVSEVDCPNSGLFFHRNDELYVTKSTTTQAPIYRPRGRQRVRPNVAPPVPRAQPAAEAADPAADTAAAAPIANNPTAAARPAGAPEAEIDDYYDDYDYVRPRRPPRRRRPWRRKRPIYHDYDDYDDYYDTPRRRIRPRYQRREEDEVESEEDLPPRRLKKRKERNRIKQEDIDYDDKPSKPAKTSASTTTTTAEPTEPPPFDPMALVKTREELFSMSRAPPKIKPPVPLSERTKYNQMQGRASTSTTPTAPETSEKSERNRASASSSKSVENEQYDQYYDEEYDQPQQAPAKKSSKYLPFPTTTATTTTTTKRTTTTTTTTPAPQYDYEYEEYEYDQGPTTTTTTTTTTTPRPSLRDRRRNSSSRKQQQIESETVKPTPQEPNIQENNISTPKTKETQSKDSVEGNSRGFRQSYLRARPTLFTKTVSTTTPVPTTTTTTEKPTPPRQFIRTRVFSSTENQAALLETTTQKSRSNRFWQRPTTYNPSKATTTTTTTSTQAPEQVDYVYYDDTTVPLTRYGQRAATTYQQYSSVPEYVSDSPDPSAPPPAQAPSQEEQTEPPRPDVFRSNPVTSRFPLSKAIEQTNYVTPITTQTLIPKTTAATYLQFNHHPQAPQSRPEFISLLPEDEEDSSYYPTGGSEAGSSHMISMISPNNAQSQPPPPQQQQQDQQYTSQSQQSQSYEQQRQPQQSYEQRQSPPYEQQRQSPPYEQQRQSPPYEQQRQSPPYDQSRQSPTYEQQRQSPSYEQPQAYQQQQNPQISRFRNQITRMFTSPQELYPVYTTPPQYIKTVRARHVFPTMFLPFVNY